MAGAAGLVAQVIVLAFGAATLGGPDALRLLRQLAGRSPAVDLAMCVVLISLLTAPLLGTMLLARFVRKVRAGGGAAPATDLFARVTAAVSVGAAFLVTACLLVVPGGGLGAVRLPVDFAVKNPVAVTVLATVAICAASAAAAAAGSLPCTGFFRGAVSAGGPAAPAPPATTTKVAVFLAVAAMSSLVAAFVATGGFDAHAQLLYPEFHWRRGRNVIVPVGVAIVAVAGTTLLARCSRRARKAAGAGGGAAARTC